MRFRLLVAAGAALSTAAVAPAATSAGSVITLGSAAVPSSACGSGTTVVQKQVGGDPGYVTPIAGVITSVSYYASAPGSIRVVFLKPAAMANHWDSLGYSSPFAATDVLNTYPTRLRIGSGVTLGLFVSGTSMGCLSAATGSDTVASGLFDPTLGTDFAPAVATPNSRVDLAVSLEPDADNDGYGDVTQDLCPTSDLTHASCDNVTEPDTTFTKKPAKHGTKRRIRAAFTSTVPGSTFECSLDQRPFQPCTSPLRKRVHYGKHVLKVQAVGPAGLVDQSPASVVFRVVRPPH